MIKIRHWIQAIIRQCRGIQLARLSAPHQAWVSLGLALWITLSPAALASSAIFGGGPFYSGGTATMNALRSSGYTTVNLWTLHVYADAGGSLIYNDQLVVANGAYVGNAAWPAQLATLKTAPTSVKRIEWSVGSWGANDFLAIKTLMDTYGTNPDSLLYRNFLALKNATGADAIQFDDETQYDVTTAVRFGRMLSAIGYKVALCPYTNPTFWQSVYNQLGTGIVDAVYLQCYAGGAWNDPATWNSYFTGTKVIPGMWCRHDGGTAGSSASQVQAQMTSWRSSAGITGGFMWLYDDMLSFSSGDTPAAYAMAINMAVNAVTPPSVTETDLSLSGGSFAPLAGNNLILGNAGTSALSVTNAPDATGIASVLTDGNPRSPQTGGPLGIEGGSITYSLGSGENGIGFDITGIRSLSAWADGGRFQPKYTVSYSLDGTSFINLGSVNYNKATGNGADVSLAIDGLTHVVSVRFDFSGGQQNGWVSYTELAVFGTSSKLPDPAPTQIVFNSSVNPSLPGTSVTFSATVQDNGVTAGSATGNVVFLIDGSVVSTSAIVNGSASYTTSTLTGGTHTINAVYSGDAGYATSANSLVQINYQPPSVTETDLCLTSGSFAAPATNNLILGNAGTSTLTTVTYTGTAANLTDGVLQAPGSPGTSSSIVMIKSGAVTYSLGNGSEGLGFTLTGIRSLTAWTNNTRINPKYSVSYSEDGVTFMPLATVIYSSPTGTKGTDVTLAISGATHVKYLQFTFPNSQQNSGVAYSELAAYGTSTQAAPVSMSAPILLPASTSVVLNLNGLVTGHSYTVQSSPSLAAGSWSDEATFTATQATAAFTYPVTGIARRFYRLKF